MVDIITSIPAHPSNYGPARELNNIKYIVLHYTANDGDKDQNNAKYFASPNRKASAHYFVDDDSIHQSVADNQVAWSVGGRKYPSCSASGGGTFYGICTNANSISIEMCDTHKDGVYNLSQETRNNASDLVAYLMKKYSIPLDNVIRHFDVVGKLCPRYWATKDNPDWNMFKLEVLAKFNGSTTQQDSKKEEPKQPKEETVEEKNSTNTFKIRVTVDDLRIRIQPSNVSKIVGYTRKGVFTIVELSGTFGKLKSGLGWVDISEPKCVTILDDSIKVCKKSNEEVAREVIKGLWGNDPVRKSNLEMAGYNYTTIQNLVNKILKG